MKNFRRNDPWLSLCGLNCGLCPMRLGKYCPGCGQGEGNQGCATARCSLERGGLEYCWQCGDFPCGRYQDSGEFDAVITTQNRFRDIRLAQKIGVEAYGAQQREKLGILNQLLAGYNDGRKKTLFCLAVNLLPLENLQTVMAQLGGFDQERPLKERAAAAASLLQEQARRHGVELKLRKRTRKQ